MFDPEHVAWLNARQVRRALEAGRLDKAEAFTRGIIGALNRTPRRTGMHRAFRLLNAIRSQERGAVVNAWG